MNFFVIETHNLFWKRILVDETVKWKRRFQKIKRSNIASFRLNERTLRFQFCIMQVWSSLKSFRSEWPLMTWRPVKWPFSTPNEGTTSTSFLAPGWEPWPGQGNCHQPASCLPKLGRFWPITTNPSRIESTRGGWPHVWCVLPLLCDVVWCGSKLWSIN